MKGSCLCGEVCYEISLLEMPIMHCHCKTCRKAHAAPFASTAGVKREHFRWLSGEEFLSTYESSPGKLRHFCRQCGSHLVAERPSQPHVILRALLCTSMPAEQKICEEIVVVCTCQITSRKRIPKSSINIFAIIASGSL